MDRRVFEDYVGKLFFERDDMVGEGKQSRVYSRPNFDFVIKIPRKGTLLKDFILGHKEAAENLDGLAAEFSLENNLWLGYSLGPGNFELKTYNVVVVQEKVKPLNQLLHEKVMDGKIGEAQSYVRALAELDKQILRVGSFVKNLHLSNYGLREGSIVLQDIGDISDLTRFDGTTIDASFNQKTPQDRGSEMNYRGMSHYWRDIVLGLMSPAIRDAYREASGINFPNLWGGVTIDDFRKWRENISLSLKIANPNLPEEIRSANPRVLDALIKNPKTDFNLMRLIMETAMRHKYDPELRKLSILEMSRAGYGTQQGKPMEPYLNGPSSRPQIAVFTYYVAAK